MKKPGFYLLFKLLSVVCLGVLVLAIVLLVKGFDDFESNNYLIGMLLMPFSIMGTVACGIFGFQPEIVKLRTRSAKYIQEENKDDLKDIATTGAQIQSEAVTTTARAVSEGLAGKKYCKHCGKPIDADSQFCCECGGEV